MCETGTAVGADTDERTAAAAAEITPGACARDAIALGRVFGRAVVRADAPGDTGGVVQRRMIAGTCR